MGRHMAKIRVGRRDMEKGPRDLGEARAKEESTY